MKRSEVAVIVSKFKKTGLGTQIGNAAVEAITAGPGSKEWKRYMALFCDTPEELERLTKPKAGEDSYLRKARAYIVANAICASETGTVTANAVDERIDANLTAALSPEEAEAIGNPQTLRDELGFEITRF